MKSRFFVCVLSQLHLDQADNTRAASGGKKGRVFAAAQIGLKRL